MKLIIEKKDGSVYVYRETEKHYSTTQPKRKNQSPRLNPRLLDQECDISNLGDFHMVFNLKG